MATIDLTIKNGEYSYHGLRMVVKTETCQEFKIFERRRYKAKDENKFFYLRIKIDEIKSITKHLSGRGSDSDYVNYIDVYFSKLDDKNPLIFEFRQNNLSNYFKYREIFEHKTGFYTLGPQYSNGFQLWDNLLTENDILNNKITYRIDRKQSYNHVDVKKIENKDGYVVYEHKAKKDYKSSKSCVLYKNFLYRIRTSKNIYEDKDGESEDQCIKEVQNLEFKCINTYYQLNRDDQTVPLLVEFIKSDGKRYYFSRKNQNESYWTPEDIEDEKPSKNILDNIDFLLNNSVSVFLHRKVTYGYNQKNHMTEDYNLLSDYNESSSIIDDKKVKVSPDNKDINDLGYESYKHYLSPYTGNIKDGRVVFIVVKLFIYNKEIHFYDQKGELVYLIHSADNYEFDVYFYKNDNFPLLVKFGGKWYGPESRQDYLSRWKEVKFKNYISFNDETSRKQFIEKLHNTICMLNQINLRSIDDYGFEEELDEFSSKKAELDRNNENLDFIRVKIVYELYDIYTKFTHTPKNNFKFNKSYLIKESFEKEIKQTFLSVEAKSVSIYFFHKDAQANREYPLILEFNLDSQKYEYYVLEPDGLTFGKYDNKSINGKKIVEKELDILLQHQNFIFNSVGCLRLDKKCYYTCCDSQISCSYIDYRKTCSYRLCFIKSDKNKKFCDISGSFIDVKKSDQTNIKSCYTSYEHSLGDSLKHENHKDFRSRELGPNKTYLITNKIKIFHKNINLKYKNGNVLRLFPIRSCSVYFYDKDPRPILLSCNNYCFAPKTIEQYYKEWVLLDSSELCKPQNNEYSILLEYKLSELCYYLNPVDVSISSSYTVDKLFRMPIISVENKETKSFRMLTYRSCPGCNLGMTRYKNYNVFENYNKCIYKSSNLKKVVAYYYILDSEYRYPLLIEFEFERDGMLPNKFNHLYQLISINPHKWEPLSLMSTEDFPQNNYSFSSLISSLYHQISNHSNTLIETKDLIHDSDQFDLDISLEDFSINNNTSDILYSKMADSFVPFEPLEFSVDIPFYETQKFDQYKPTKSTSIPYYDFYYNFNQETPQIDFEQFNISREVKSIDINDDLESGRTQESSVNSGRILTRSKRDAQLTPSENEISDSTGSSENLDNSNSSNLAAALGGTFGFLVCVGLVSYPAYKYLKKFKIKDMRPFLN